MKIRGLQLKINFNVHIITLRQGFLSSTLDFEPISIICCLSLALVEGGNPPGFSYISEQ